MLDKLLVDPSSLSETERLDWARFVFSLLKRHPKALAVRKSQLESLRSSVVEGMLARAQGATEHVQDAIDRIDFDALLHQINLSLFVEDASDSEALEYLAGFRLFLITGSWGFQLPTSDLPLVLNMGHGEELQMYTMSLTPNALLVAANAEENFLDDEMVKMAIVIHSGLVVQQAAHVYSREPLADGIPLKMKAIATSDLPLLPWRKR